MDRTKKAVENFKTKKILVVGDLMLDLYTYGEVSRISPEAPIPVFLKTGEKYVLGGAANVVNNLSSLGAQVAICGRVGKDHNGGILMSLLKERGIETSLVVELNDYPTILKQRVVAGNHQMIRVDEEQVCNLDKATRSDLLAKITEVIYSFDAIIFSDYGKGMFSKDLTRPLIKIAKKHKKLVIADTRPSNKSLFIGVDLITPNLKEAVEMSGTDNIQKIGKKLTEYFKSDVLVTKGKEGMSVFERNGRTTDLPARKVEVFDVSGAGDTIVAVLALGLACGLNIVDAANLANYAGGVVVQKPGTAVITLEELEASLGETGHVEKVEIIPKVWGYEKWLENNDKYCSKILWVNKGYQCSLHYHKLKDETFLITSGHIRLELGNEILHMMAGSFVRVLPGVRHRFRGIEDSEILEISTHHNEEDSYRIEESRKVKDGEK